MTVEYAIPVIMGANVGTSITSALVSLGQVVNYYVLKMSLYLYFSDLYS